MAAGNTTDTRTHVLGDLYMLTGTFTDGGTDVSYDGHLSSVLAAGGHLTSSFNTGVLINNGGGYAAGTTGAMTVDTIDPRLHFNIGETIYSATGARIGVITALGALAITCGAGTLVAVANNDAIHKFGAFNPAVTLQNGTLDVSVDETNKFVVFGLGNEGAASTANTHDGRWWILGKR
tara:strand:+ start:7287 stop:7820 length:534 start_codon:yes stop_codon:yes gene_type:complete